MTTLTLTELYVAPVADLSQIVTFNVRTESETLTSRSGVRPYAGGRDRIIGRPGSSMNVPFTALNVDRDDWLTLRDLVGTLCLFREPRGRAIYGTILSLSGDEWKARQTTLGSLSFIVTQVTYSEIV